MARVVGIDHIVLRVGDYKKSKAFYSKLLTFLGFKILDEFELPSVGRTARRGCGSVRLMRSRRSANIASARSGSIIMPSSSAAGRMSTLCRRSWKRRR